MAGTLKLMAGIVLGGVLGFALYRFVGCSTGDCPLTSNPWVSTLYGVILGGAISAVFRKQPTRKGEP